MLNSDSFITLFSNYSLHKHNTFGFDVRARSAAHINNVSQFEMLHLDRRLSGQRLIVLGDASNVVLMRDFDGAVLFNKITGRSIISEDNNSYLIEVGGGENWHSFVKWTIHQGMAGLENLALIPGTVGAAPIQNIGAYGVEMKTYFDSLIAINLKTGCREYFNTERCAFSYRDSFFKRQKIMQFAIVSVVFRLPKHWTSHLDYTEISKELDTKGIMKANATPYDVFKAIIAIRRAKLPDHVILGNVGSFFKNPLVSFEQLKTLRLHEPGIVWYSHPSYGMMLSAGWLIERCGWKGRTFGDVSVYDRQAVVLVNRGGATGENIIAIADKIQRDVKNRFGVELEIEPVCI
ncbi:MAG: UDP-N-acetylmuramate dehydrogenase [Burkholderia sp.]|nr:UDP-N-acetylmuramate dehydrogenase [Burkholderia sp.]